MQKYDINSDNTKVRKIINYFSQINMQNVTVCLPRLGSASG